MFKFILAIFCIVLAIAIHKFDKKIDADSDYSFDYGERLERLKRQYSSYHDIYYTERFNLWLDRFFRMWGCNMHPHILYLKITNKDKKYIFYKCVYNKQNMKEKGEN